MQRFIFFFFSLLLLWTSSSSLSAQEITLDVAKEKAAQFFDKSVKLNTSRKAPRKKLQLELANNRDEFFIFNDEANGGYVVVSGDERMPDVLGYSYTGHFDENMIPDNMRAWLEDYAKQVIYLRTHPEVQASKRIASEREEVKPLINCHFNQGKYYYDKCPLLNGEHCPTGCVATAMAQIMYYYQWPRQTTNDIPGYTTSTKMINVPAVPQMTINWDNIVEEYNQNQSYSDEQIEAISTLMLLCGTSVKMDYDISGSGAGMTAAGAALRKFFDYDDLIESVSRYGDLEAWEQMLYEELDGGQPVLYSGQSDSNNSGHAFVLDGYRDGYFHVNWGWGGHEDDYFLLTDLNEFNYDQDAIIGIKPAYPDGLCRYAVFDNGKMTLYYDKERNQRQGTVLPHQDDWPKEQITECVIDQSFANLNPRSLSGFFSDWSQLKSIEGIENINTSKVTNMYRMFSGCSGLKNLDVSRFKTDNVMDMSWMFYGCSGLTSLDVSGFKTDNVTNMGYMFSGCSGLKNLDVSAFKTDNVTNMYRMFYGCSDLKNLDVSGFKTDNVTDMNCMFYGCSGLTNLDVSAFKTDLVTNMGWMFSGCSGLTSLDVSGFKTDLVTDMLCMFYGCSGLTSLDVSGFKTDLVTDMSWMFSDCRILRTIYASEKWNMSNVESSSNMFYGCNNLIGGAGTSYIINHSDGDYARIDGGLENPGYFTYKENKTAIHTIKANEDYGNIYGLSGVRLRSGTKSTEGLKHGIYIIKGKKFFVK